MGRATALGYCVSLVALSSLLPADLAAAEAIDFNRDIRPLLSARCFACHGPDEEDRQAGLRLDEAAAATAELDSGLRAIVPGQAAASEMLARITSADPDVVMPPPEVGKPITPAEAELLARWITDGAEYRDHWAFERVERPAVPNVADSNWPLTPIDRFIMTRLIKEGLEPNAEADRATLARRLALDLTGLPPEPATVAAFLADKNPGAYERYVDRLLASPHYGERMAIEWLDAARYADSHGYQTDSSRSNWPWRDWVINAFNQNLPFDQFTIEQLAGDMLPEPTREQIVATGFNRNHRINGEGGIIAEEWRVETVIDRVETTGQTWLGLTVGCARCHDHKYDPLSQREFYSLFALFNNVPESGTIMGRSNRSGGNSDPILRLPDELQQAQLAKLEQVVADAQTVVATELKNLPSLVEAWAAEARASLDQTDNAWQPFEPLELASAGGASFRRSEDGSWLVEGAAPPQDSYTFESLIPPGSFGGFRLELLPVAELAGGGFGRGGNGNVVVTKIEAEIDPPGDGKTIPVVFTRADASYEQRGWEAAKILSGKKGDGWAIDGNQSDNDAPRQIALFPERPIMVPENSRLVVTVRQESQFAGHTIARFRLAFSTEQPSLLGVSGTRLPEEVRKGLEAAAEDRTPEQQKRLESFYRAEVDGPIKRVEAAREAAQQSLEAFRNSLTSAMVMQEGKPRDAFVLGSV